MQRVYHQTDPGITPGRPVSTAQRKRIIVFSPDADLASNLALLLADMCETIVETGFSRLSQRIQQMHPALVIVDLFSLPADAVQQLRSLEQAKLTVPVILLRSYRSNEEIERIIEALKGFVIYKPANVEMVTTLVAGLLEPKQQRGIS
jgi:DNA-binding NtrC family response regulator